MKIFFYLFLSSLLIIVYSCNKQDNQKMQGEWRVYYNDAFVEDFNISADTIKRMMSGWNDLTLVFFKDMTFFNKEDSSVVLKIISQVDSNTFIVNFGGPYLCKMERIRNRSMELPVSIKFNFLYPEKNNDSCLCKELKNEDYLLDIGGSYKLNVDNKIYTGWINESSLKQLVFYINAIDTSNKNLTDHSFAFAVEDINYCLEFTYKDSSKVNYNISDMQPVQLVRVTSSLEEIWNEIMIKSGYRFM